MQVCHHLPKEYDALRVHCESLPMGQQSPAFPFSGFVINLCTCTIAHRDHGDLQLCVVIPFGDWKGGELCLHEPRLVFEAAPGDLIIFPSSDITHFNLHMTGTRGSLVLQTDKALVAWTDYHNFWGSHMAPQSL